MISTPDRGTAPGADEFEISVLGPGFGESIVLFLPGVGWGVIDGCRDTLDYLKAMKIGRLAFVALTHPDTDHYRGLTPVLQHYRGSIDRLWIYSGKGATELQALQKALIEHGHGDFHGFAAFVDEFEKARLAGARTREMSAIKEMLPPTQIPSGPGRSINASIRAVAPSAADSQYYFRELAAAFPRRGEVLKPLPRSTHNAISAALLVTVGARAFVLGGDVEAGRQPDMGWAGVVSDENTGSLRADMIKVSHHGSEGSHLDAAWQAHGASGGRKVGHGALTPYYCGKVPLPKEADLGRLAGLVDRIHLTAEPKLLRPITVYPATGVKLVRRLSNWGVIRSDFGHVRYRGPLEGTDLNVDIFGQAIEVCATTGTP